MRRSLRYASLRSASVGTTGICLYANAVVIRGGRVRGGNMPAPSVFRHYRDARRAATAFVTRNLLLSASVSNEAKFAFSIGS